jgi:hypothetical protein
MNFHLSIFFIKNVHDESYSWNKCVVHTKSDKGNSKITELRTILQRECQNSTVIVTAGDFEP